MFVGFCIAELIVASNCLTERFRARDVDLFRLPFTVLADMA